ncbi:hypothetical protein ACTI_45240 [Actinoplanes sp. OR16]|nr:hypothetical protein ACTI_45240 [Actinoplanes sp. OR16]
MLLAGLALIITAARLLGSLVQRLGQPRVVGEILAGVLLGPTVLGTGLSAALLPGDVRPYLAGLAAIGLVLFMFLIGLELDHRVVASVGRKTVSVTVGSIVVPFVLGGLLAFHLADRHAVTHPAVFALFVALAMSVTAFPVLARILTDRGLNRTRLGCLALTCAALDDVIAWTLLAVTVAVAGTGGSGVWRAALLVPYALLMMYLVRPLLQRRLAGRDASRVDTLLIVAGMLLSAGLTEWMGLHYIFGAFLYGVIMPRGTKDQIRQAVRRQIEPVSALLLPVFFVVAGLAVDLRALGSAGLLDLTLILTVAVAGKFAGAFAAARLSGLPARPATALASLMNTRGLTELVILSVGLQLGLIGTGMYSLMVVMAVVTTLMAAPVLWATGYGRRTQQPLPADLPRGAETDDLAVAAAGDNRPMEER